MSSAMPRRVRPSAAVLPTDGRRQNLSLVLQTLRRLGPTSRAQLAREVGVTKVTMSHLVSELIDEGRVHDVGTAEQGGPGKRATLVDLARKGIGLDTDRDTYSSSPAIYARPAVWRHCP